MLSQAIRGNGPTSPKIRISVTRERIDTSCRRDSSHCMVADAVQDTVPRAKFISVDLQTIRFTDPIAGRRYVYLTPRRVQEAILKFDQGEKVEPFTFTIEAAHVLPTGNARKARASLEPNPDGGKKVPVRVGGQSPPIGPLFGGAPRRRRGQAKRPNEGAGTGTSIPGNIGRRREFGLRQIIR